MPEEKKKPQGIVSSRVRELKPSAEFERKYREEIEKQRKPKVGYVRRRRPYYRVMKTT